MKQPLTDRLWKDSDGNQALMQFPNAPLWVWLLATVLARVFRTGAPHTVLSILAGVSLVIWALLELLRGDSYFRRILGAAVLLAIAIGRLS